MAQQPTTQGEGTPVPARRRLRLGLAAVAVCAGLIGLVASLTGLVVGLMPRQFSAAEQQKIIFWEMAKRWRTWPAGKIFPARVTYGLPGRVLDSSTGLDLSARRVGIAPQAPCAAAVDRAAARVLAGYGCVAVLRATYVDATGAFVTTIGVVVLGGARDAAVVRPALPGSGDRRPGVRAVAFPGTLTASFADRSRQVGSSIPAGPYVVMYTAGYADGRPYLVGEKDQYALDELRSASHGIAAVIGRRIGAPPASPHCPGAPGC